MTRSRRSRNSAQLTSSEATINLLFLTPQLPYPPRQGTAIRNWGLIQHLAQRHSVTLLAFSEIGQVMEAPELKAVCRQVLSVPAPRRTGLARLRTMLSPHPDLARRLWSPALARTLGDLLNQTTFDAAHLEGLEMAPYLSSFSPRPPQLIYDAHNAEHILQQRAWATDVRQPARWPAALYSWLQLPRLKKFEADICRQVDAVTCVSNEDAAALQKLVPGLKPVVVPNGIDVAEYREVSRPPSTVFRSPSLVFTGKMDYRPNIDAALWFAEAIFPRLHAAWPEAQFIIVGQKPPERLTRLNGQNGIVVTGLVEDARPYIADAAVYVAPLRMGGGTRFKLLEAMALARPIVATTIGAEGFEIQAGRELLLADTPDDFAEAVLALLNDSARAKAVGQAGYAFVREKYDWSVIVPRLEAVYNRSR